MLLGRGAECERLDGLLAEARQGQSGALVIAGEAGIGKTALLNYASEQAGDMTVLTARGLESESELPFLGLADLLRPVRRLLNFLPRVQSAALRGAFALGPPVAVDRFTIYVAALSLLSIAAAAKPVLAVVDDAQWLDAASIEALLFSALRLLADGIVLLFAVRSSEPGSAQLGGLPLLSLRGLSLEASRRLLLQRHERWMNDSVAERLHASTAGNPLALLELSGILSPRQLAGTDPLPDPLPAGPTLQRAFNRHLARLSREGQRAMLLAAASQSGAIDVITRAMARMGLTPAALEEGELNDLVVLEGATVRFAHPLLRSAVYHSAPAPVRRAAHRALAESLDADRQQHQHAWHMAAATTGPDESVASLLERAAANARSRAGYAAAAAALERAADLTASAEERARRLLAAADAAWLGGQPARALMLLDRADEHASVPLLRADIAALRGQVVIWHGSPRTAIDALMQAATTIEGVDSSRAARMLVLAASGCYMTAQIEEAYAIARRAHDAGRRAGGSTELVTGVSLASALMLRGRADQGMPHIERAFSEIGRLYPQDAFEIHRQAAFHLMNVEDFRRARVMLEWILDTGRKLSAPAMLPYPLACMSEVEYRTGRWEAAYAQASEAVRLARETGQPGPSAYGLVCLARVEAALGWANECHTHVNEALEAAAPLGIDSLRDYAAAAIGFLELGLGHPGKAVQSLEFCARLGRTSGLQEPSVVQWAPDMIEACIREGQFEQARNQLEHLAGQAEKTGRTWALAAVARCRGLLPGEEAYDDHFQEALCWHDRVEMPFERARTELAYGETLRRHGRRSEARKPLTSALETFERLGAQPWTARTSAELAATGMRVRRSRIPASHQLTPQELQVALAVARGATNREAAAQLFLSLKTVEAHLTSAYSKLGLRSRSQLAAMFARELDVGSLASAEGRTLFSRDGRGA